MEQGELKIEDEAYDRHWDMLWNVQLGIRYHMHMQNFYGRFGKLVTVFTLILSTSAGATILSSNLLVAKLLAFAAAILQSLELVVDSKSKTTLHTTLRQRYIQLESELSHSDTLSKKEFASFKAKRALIEVEEPPIVFSLMDKCHNELAKVHALDSSKEKQEMGCIKTVIAWVFS